MVPILTWGLVRSNLCFAIGFASLTGYYNHFAKTRLKQTGWTNYRQTKHRFDQLKTKLNTEQTRYQPTKCCHKKQYYAEPGRTIF
jgi:hypothetical protein